MISPRLFPAALVALSLAAAGATLRAQAVEQTLYVGVVDKAGAVVTGLGERDFVVREDQVVREVLRVVPADEPMQIALLVDDSQAADPFIRDYRQALQAFVAAVINDEVGVKHQIAIITLANRPTIITEYTSNPAELQKGIGRIFAQSSSGSLLLDALIETSQGIMKRASTRPVIVALTTEGAELSQRSYAQVLTPLKASNAALHVIGLGRPTNQSQDRSIVLSRGPAETGGVYDTLLASTALTGRLKQLASELTQQYRVVYARPRSLIPPEKITVSAAKPGLTARGTPAVEPPRSPVRP
jgi:VWFA-related protein